MWTRAFGPVISGVMSPVASTATFDKVPCTLNPLQVATSNSQVAAQLLGQKLAWRLPGKHLWVLAHHPQWGDAAQTAQWFKL